MTQTLEFDHDIGSKKIARAAANEPRWLETACSDFDRNGFVVLRGAADPSLCDQVAQDYLDYLAANAEDANANIDAYGRHRRLVNFHLWSQAAMKLGASARPMELLDLLFKAPASIYTSLFFEYSTEQTVHRDSPFFETFPRNLFVGVWYALEDIDPKSGPLFVHPGAHRIESDPRLAMAEARERFPDADQESLVQSALDIYYRNVAEGAAASAPPITLSIRKGDVVVWHALAPHGGSPAIDKSLRRRSMVFHCTPEDVQVYQQETFFLHVDETPPGGRYGYDRRLGRQVALAGGTAFQR